MKYKITRRLIGYFSAVLLFFSVIVGILFWALFTWHTARLQEQDLKTRAISIANTLSQFPQLKHPGEEKGNGYKLYLRLIDEIAMSEVWLVDEKAQTIEVGQIRNSLSYEELPSGAEHLIKQVFKGNVETNREFSSLLDVPSITVGAPVKDEKGTIIAVLLLHSPIDGIGQAQQDGITILVFCILAALILAAILSIFLVQHFIEPLKKMGNVTKQIIKGDYQIHTDVKQNDEIGLLARNIDELSFKLSQTEQERKMLDEMRQDFISNISHELRTPVTVIKGSLEVLEENLITDPKEMKEYFHQMLIDVTYLQRLVNDLLEISRLQNSNFHIEKSALNLTEVLTEAIHSMQRAAEQKQIKIIVTNEVGAIFFFGDYGRLRQMFTIILDNAVKFSLFHESIEVKLQEKEESYFISILDHGTGILETDIPYIFDRFYRERSEQNKSGSGLGLSIAKQIAERHNITIQCFSKPNVETCFLFQLKKDLTGFDISEI